MRIITLVVYWYKEAFDTRIKSYQAKRKAGMAKRNDSEHIRR
jgi:hypothetical protein